MSVEIDPRMYDGYAAEAEPLRVVVAGGGSGAAALLKGIRETMPDADLTGIVSVTDDGGSTGRLMRQYDTQPVGDLCRGLASLVEDERIARRMEHRLGEHDTPETVRAIGRGLLGMLTRAGHEYDETFALSIMDRAVGIAAEQDELAGHKYGNLLLTAAITEEGGLREASTAVGAMVNAKGRIIPVSDVHHRLVLTDGQAVHVGEHVIDGLTDFENPESMELAFTTNMTATAETIDLAHDLVPVPASIQATEAISEADVLLTGHGSWLTSVLPLVQAGGFREAVEGMKGQSVLVSNIEVQPDTKGMQVAHFLGRTVSAIGRVDAVVYNEDVDTLVRNGLEPVMYTHGSIADVSDGLGPSLIGKDLVAAELPEYDENDAVQLTRTKVTTRGDVVGEAIIELLNSKPCTQLATVA